MLLAACSVAGTTKPAKHSIPHRVLREWQPNNHNDSYGADLLIEQTAPDKDELLFFLYDLTRSYHTAVVTIYTSETAYQEDQTGNYTDEHKKGILLVYLKFGESGEVRWMQEIGPFEHLFGTTIKF